MAIIPSERTEATRLDRDLVQRCRRGDLGAFEDMYKRFGGRLYTVAYRITGSAADAEDLVQDIFLQAYRRLDTFRGEAALGTWLHRLAVNACLDFVRSKQGRRQRMTDPVEDLDALEAPATGPWRAEAALDRLDLERAIDLYTRGSAHAEFAETVKGTLEPGKLADLVVFHRDLFAVPPREILATPVDLTVVGGRVVFERTQP